MGNKVNVLGYRNKKLALWSSLYYDRANHTSFVYKELLSKNFLKEYFYLRNFSISNIYFDKINSNNSLYIYCNIYPILNNTFKNNSFKSYSNFHKRYKNKLLYNPFLLYLKYNNYNNLQKIVTDSKKIRLNSFKNKFNIVNFSIKSLKRSNITKFSSINNIVITNNSFRLKKNTFTIKSALYKIYYLLNHRHTNYVLFNNNKVINSSCISDKLFKKSFNYRNIFNIANIYYIANNKQLIFSMEKLNCDKIKVRSNKLIKFNTLFIVKYFARYLKIKAKFNKQFNEKLSIFSTTKYKKLPCYVSYFKKILDISSSIYVKWTGRSVGNILSNVVVRKNSNIKFIMFVNHTNKLLFFWLTKFVVNKFKSKKIKYSRNLIKNFKSVCTKNNISMYNKYLVSYYHNYVIFLFKTDFSAINKKIRFEKLSIQNKPLILKLNTNKSLFSSTKFKIRRLETNLLYNNKKYFIYLFIKYNIIFINNIIKNIFNINSIKWSFVINDKMTLGSTEVTTIIKKKLKKLKNQRKLYNPLRLVLNQINFNYKLNIIFFNTNLISSTLDIYNNKYRNLKHNLVLNSFNILLSCILKNNSLTTFTYNTIYLKRFSNKKLNIGLNLYKNNNFISYLYNNLNYKQELIKYRNTLFTYINKYLKTNLENNKYFLIPSINSLLKYTTIGYKIEGFGRLGFSSKSTRKSKTMYLRGKTALTSLNTFIDYTSDISIIRNGVYGIKIYKFYKSYNNTIKDNLKLYI